MRRAILKSVSHSNTTTKCDPSLIKGQNLNVLEWPKSNVLSFLNTHRDCTLQGPTDWIWICIMAALFVFIIDITVGISVRTTRQAAITCITVTRNHLYPAFTSISGLEEDELSI